MKLQDLRKEIKMLILISLGAIVGYIYVVRIINYHLIMDESFTIGLIRNGFKQIIQIDSMDVHPPLYYLVIKVIFSFTKLFGLSIDGQIISLRIFSAFCLYVTIYFLKKSLNLMNKNVSNMIYVIFLLMPYVAVYGTQIRMYQFLMAIISVEVFSLLKYLKTNNFYWLIGSVLLAEMAAYTHYFGAVLAGLLLLFVFFKHLLDKNLSGLKAIITAVFIFLIMFVPWGIVAIKQILTVKGDYWITKSESLNAILNIFGPYKFYFYILGVIILIGYFINLYDYRFNKFNKYYLIICLLFLLVYGIGNSALLINRPILIDRYLYPIYSLFLFNGLVQLTYMKRNSKRIALNGLIVCFAIITCFNITKYTFNTAQNMAGVPTQKKQSINFDFVLLDFNEQDIKNIYVDNIFNQIVTNPDHKFYIKQNIYEQLIISYHTRLLFQKIYPNLVVVNDFNHIK